ncbi:alpha-amylase family protein [Tellurirhabdus rosea]|uniref:alpha-amylase family protein n=1 Tax=Tellurirhabdus rosea TaxID=2674997 RepID=UPI0022548CC1|nr:alpha-amylase family protein [Tellurirhabdus rosea]
MRYWLLLTWVGALFWLHPALSQPRPTDFIRELWYKNGVIYNLDVKVFNDSNGDGIGDFNGLTAKLDYLKDLGVTVIWLAPFQPSPGEDDGYDVSDFLGIDKRLGTTRDFQNFMQQAKRRGFRVMMDLVVNHTSNQHPWFQQARKSKSSPFRSWYVWSEKRPRDADKGMVFPGVQKETWSYDSLAGEYFFHRFYRFQPDLNAQNAAVQAEVRKAIRHWLALGLDGFRLDAVPFFIEVPGTNIEKPEHQFDLMYWLRQYAQWRKGDVGLLGEINVEPGENKQYFGENGQGLHMLFNFYVNQFLFYSLASGEVKTLLEALEKTKELPATAQWAHFLRNHDEIDLARLSNRQREAVFARMGPDKNMQLYDRGIRRRLAPMLSNPQQLRMVYSLLFSLPGTPVLRYGEEIGMGDDLRLKERFSIRTPMQWSSARNGGFSTAAKTLRPAISGNEYGYQRVNVAAQRKDSASLLNHIRHLIRLRGQYPEISRGEWRLLESDSPHVLALAYEGTGRTLVTLLNFSDKPQTARFKLAGKTIRTVFAEGSARQKGSADLSGLEMPAYGYRWIQVQP